MRQLLGLADRHEAGIQRERDCGCKEVAARFDADDDIDRGGFIVIAQSVDGFAKACFVLKQRGDVVEIDARLGEIGDFADQLL